MHTLAEIPFKFELPIEVWEKAGEPGKERRIGGVISTEARDRQGEIVLQRGLDFSEFTKNGWFNDNHSKETTGIVGYPTKVERGVQNGRPSHFVEGYLLPEYEPANKIWNLARSLQKTGRRLGFSIEGSVVRRTGPNQSVIAEAKVRNVAITNCPVNTDTGLDVLTKSIQAMENLDDAWFRRAMMAGQGTAGTTPSGFGVGAPLRAQSLEHDAKVLDVPKRKRLTKAEAVEFLRSKYRGMTDAYAERIFQFALQGAT
jgi:hypothetical protein